MGRKRGEGEEKEREREKEKEKEEKEKEKEKWRVVWRGFVAYVGVWCDVWCDAWCDAWEVAGLLSCVYDTSVEHRVRVNVCCWLVVSRSQCADPVADSVQPTESKGHFTIFR